MTIYCYKDGIMAADSAVFGTNEIIVGERDKIVRGADGSIAAACGPSHIIDLFSSMMSTDGCKDISGTDLDDVEGLIVRPDGSTWVLRQTSLVQIRCPFYAGGAAWEIAFGAMAAGATAEQAVRIAIQYHHHAGGIVQVMTLAKIKTKEE